MSSINKIKNLRNRIENRTSEITKEQIIAHNRDSRCYLFGFLKKLDKLSKAW